MLRALSRPQALLLALAVLLACLWAMTLRPAEAPPGLPGAGSYSDNQLYHDIAARVARGEDYYAAATALHRQHQFPTRPFVTVRLPVLVTAAAHLGWGVLWGVLIALLALAIAVWFRLLEPAAPGERLGTVAALLTGGAMVSQSGLASEYELWAGLLLTTALALRGTARWPWALAATGLALAIRELALPFALLALLFALIERRRAEALGWAGLIAGFAAALALHAGAVHAATLPGDLASQGWNGLRGAGAVLTDLVDNSLLNMLPLRLAYPAALLALLGWLAVPLPQARFAVLWFAGYALMLALFARPENIYWAIVLLPAWFIGFAFIPRALADLAHAALAGRPAPL